MKIMKESKKERRRKNVAINRMLQSHQQSPFFSSSSSPFLTLGGRARIPGVLALLFPIECVIRVSLPNFKPIYSARNQSCFCLLQTTFPHFEVKAFLPNSVIFRSNHRRIASRSFSTIEVTPNLCGMESFLNRSKRINPIVHCIAHVSIVLRCLPFFQSRATKTLRKENW